MQHCADCYPKIYQQQPKPYSTLLMKTFQIWKLFLLADLILFIHPVISDSKKIKIELSLVLSVPAEEQFLVFKLYFSKEPVWRISAQAWNESQNRQTSECRKEDDWIPIYP